MDPHIFADPDPDPDLGSQNLADPTDPDPKHWIKLIQTFFNYVYITMTHVSNSLLKPQLSPLMINFKYTYK